MLKRIPKSLGIRIGIDDDDRNGNNDIFSRKEW